MRAVIARFLALFDRPKLIDDKGTVESCGCNWCRSRCRVEPGYFFPGEASRAAKFLGMDFDEFVKKFLDVKYIGTEKDDNVKFALRPKFVFFRHCIFYKRGRCSIHSVKPYECSMTHHDGYQGDTTVNGAWRYNQKEIPPQPTENCRF